MVNEVVGFLSSEPVYSNENSRIAIPKELLTSLLGKKAVEVGDEIKWDAKPDPAQIKEYIGDCQSNFIVSIALKLSSEQYIVESAHWHNEN